MKRYVRFDDADGEALRELAPLARPFFSRIAEEFYARLHEHEQARRVFAGPEQVERLKGALRQWMELLLSGPWDAGYFEKRARIGRAHVRIGLPQRYMFGAMNLIRSSLLDVAREAFAGERALGERAERAVVKILDLELMAMFETYAEAFVDKVQLL